MPCRTSSLMSKAEWIRFTLSEAIWLEIFIKNIIKLLAIYTTENLQYSIVNYSNNGLLSYFRFEWAYHQPFHELWESHCFWNFERIELLEFSIIEIWKQNKSITFKITNIYFKFNVSIILDKSPHTHERFQSTDQGTFPYKRHLQFKEAIFNLF